MSDGGVPDVRPLRVLLVEDSRFDAELLRESLLRAYPRAGLHVVADEDAYAAALADGHWDVVLSDYELPGFSGAQALQIARERRPYVPFIFVSGVIGEDNAVEMLKRGATDYVSKQRLSRLPLVLERALREVGERKGRTDAEARLREADAMFARVVDSLRNYAVVMLDRDGCIASWNEAASAMFRLEAAQVLGRSGELLYTPEDRAAGVLQQRLASALETGSAGSERWMLRGDGLEVRADSVLTPVYSDSGEHTGYCAIVRDVTERFRQSQALLAAKELAERASESKNRFLAVLSHELRTPLTPIVAATHVIERVATVPERHRHLLPMIRRNVALEARLIDDLLDLTAIGAGKVHLDLAPTDLHGVLPRVIDMLDAPLRDAQLRLVRQFDAKCSRVNADEARLQQIVWNMLRNAIKFTPAGGTVTLRTFSAEGRVYLQCIDTGVGIAPDALDRIFTAFEQGDADDARKLGGLGLGLAIARGLARQHDGELSVESAGRGEGSTFTLSIPALASSVDENPGQDAADEGDAQGCRLLLVEDNLDAAATMAELLALLGYKVTHAATCAAALEAARTQVFDVVLTDLGLPDGSGIDVGAELSATLPVIALSGYGASPDLQRSAMAGFAGHLVKPAAPEKVHAALQAALKSHRERQAVRGEPLLRQGG